MQQRVELSCGILRGSIPCATLRTWPKYACAVETGLLSDGHRRRPDRREQANGDATPSTSTRRVSRCLQHETRPRTSNGRGGRGCESFCNTHQSVS